MLNVPLPQAIGMPRHMRNQLSGDAFPVFVWGSQTVFAKKKSKFLSFRVLAGGLVMGYAKKSWLSANIKKVVEKSAI